jgi:hypothetical protein
MSAATLLFWVAAAEVVGEEYQALGCANTQGVVEGIAE